MNYNFYIRKNDDPEVEIHPFWTDNLAKQKSTEDGRRVVKVSIDGGIRLIPGNGYELILSSSIEDEFTMRISKLDEAGNGLDYYKGTFTKTDCEIDEVEEWALVELETKDFADDFAADENVELDLVGLGTRLTSVNYYDYPLLQVYALSTDSVLNLQLGAYSSRSVSRINIASGSMSGAFNFGNPVRIGYVVPGQDIPFPVEGVYTGATGTGAINDIINYTNNDGIRIVGLGVLSSDDIEVLDADGFRIGAGVLSQGRDYITVTTDELNSLVYTFRFYFVQVMARVLTREGLTYNGTLGTPLVDNDQFALNTNYTHSQPVGVELFQSTVTSQSNRGFGVYPGDLYTFSGEAIGRPSGTETIAPIARQRWADISWWIRVPVNVTNSIIAGRQPIELADAFLLEDAISTMLGAGRAGLTFNPTVEHSELLFGSPNPVTGDQITKYVLVPKSNILTFNYDTPASKAPLKIDELVLLLKTLFQGQFSIDANKLVIETEQWYENGKSYIDDDSTVFDLTSAVLSNGRAWADYAGRYTFEKQELPERIVFNWMDESSLVFEGQDIVVLSRYATKGQQEERRASRFSADLPLALTNPSAFGEDGFFILACREIDGELFVVEQEVDGFGLIPNGGLSFVYLHDKYYMDYLPANKVLINGEEIQATSTRPTKKQELQFGGLDSDIQPNDRITTNLGTGRVKSVTERLQNGSVQAVILYETN